MNIYNSLITSEHRNKPKFAAVIEAITSPFADTVAFYASLNPNYDLDTAIGNQLDVLGQWIGISRYVPVTLSGVYFEWNGEASVGWNNGIWKGPFDSDSGISVLPDDPYRTLLKAKVAANNWDGTIPSAYAIWNNLFSDGAILIQDNENMSIDLIFFGTTLSAVDRSIITNGLLPLKPEGVRINYFQSYSTAPIFAWFEDGAIPTSHLDGWGTGEWIIPL